MLARWGSQLWLTHTGKSSRWLTATSLCPPFAWRWVFFVLFFFTCSTRADRCWARTTAAGSLSSSWSIWKATLCRCQTPVVGPRRRRTPSPSLARSSCAPLNTGGCRKTRGRRRCQGRGRERGIHSTSLTVTRRRTPQLKSSEGWGGRDTACIHMTSGRVDSNGKTRSDARALSEEHLAGWRSWADRGGIPLKREGSGERRLTWALLKCGFGLKWPHHHHHHQFRRARARLTYTTWRCC